MVSTISQQVRGIVYFFGASLAVYVFHPLIFRILGITQDSKFFGWSSTVIVWLIIIFVLFFLTIAVSTKTKKEASG